MKKLAEVLDPIAVLITWVILLVLSLGVRTEDGAYYGLVKPGACGCQPISWGEHRVR